MSDLNSKILEVKNLRISFKTINGTVKAVRGIDFSLYRGKTLAIVGESGSGKSVTSRAIMGILAPNKIVEEGEILYGDQDLLRISEEEYCKIRGSKISMIFQDPLSSLNPIKKVGKQVTESMKLKRKAEKKESKKNSRIGLKHLRDYVSSHPDAGCTLEDINSFAKAFTWPDDKDMAFDLAKYRRITSDHVLTYQKTLQVTVNAEKKKALKGKLDQYEANRTVGEGKLKDKLAAFDKKIDDEGKDYKKYDFSKVEDVAVKLFKEYELALKQKYIENGKKMEDVYASFSSLEGEEFIAALKGNFKTITSLVADCRNDLALEKDELLFTFGTSIKHFMDEYKAAVKREHKAEKEAIKSAKKKDDKAPKGNNAQADLKKRAWGSEIDTSSSSRVQSLKNTIAGIITSLKGPYISSIEERLTEASLISDSKAYVRSIKDDIIEYSHHIHNEEFIERAINLLGEVGIAEPEKRIKQYPFEFSGGMRQRIVIAIALSSNPEILICDEPTTALDVTIQAQILELINNLKKSRNLSIIFITHNLGVVANMADDIAVMYAGKIVEYGSVDEIFYNPQHPYTWALLASMPDLETKARLDAIPGTPPNMIIPPKGDAFAARNKYAMAIDYEKEPPRFYVSPTHWAATWLLAKGAPKVEPPLIVTERIKRMKKLNTEAEKGID